MKLSDLLQELITTPAELEVTGLALDSRNMAGANVFFALCGARQHGLGYAGQAIANGAAVIVYDPAGLDKQPDFGEAVITIALAELDQRIGLIAARFYGYPAEKMAVIGVTGTNGKTTCTQLIAQALADCGIVGTLGWGEPGHLAPTLNTTPDALTIQAVLHGFVRQGKKVVAMEVSSHGIEQGRVNGVKFTGAVFTNFSRDHLDYHQSMEAYLQAKLALFSRPELKFAVINLDDPHSDRVLAELADTVMRWTFSRTGRVLAGAESIVAENISYSSAGIDFEIVWRDHKIQAFTPLVGRFNLENVLAVIAVLLAMDISLAEALASAATFKAIAGRMEKFGGVDDKPAVFIDYAHTPDALEKALQAIKNVEPLWLVFGCGGDRDKGKRAEMGRVAEVLADNVILTDDNPRSESAAEIIKDILTGCQSDKIRVIHNRELAIRTAILQADQHDSVLIAGKGHEQYQEINGQKLPFCDQDIVKQSLAEREHVR